MFELCIGMYVEIADVEKSSVHYNYHTNGAGIVVTNAPELWCDVCWLKTGKTTRCFTGFQDKWDIKISSKPTVINPVEGAVVDRFIKGAYVTRGPHWEWQNQDGANVGVMINTDDAPGWVKVSWKKRWSNVYRIGANGTYDLAYAEQRFQQHDLIANLPDCLPFTINDLRAVIFSFLLIEDLSDYFEDKRNACGHLIKKRKF